MHSPLGAWPFLGVDRPEQEEVAAAGTPIVPQLHAATVPAAWHHSLWCCFLHCPPGLTLLPLLSGCEPGHHRGKVLCQF